MRAKNNGSVAVSYGQRRWAKGLLPALRSCVLGLSILLVLGLIVYPDAALNWLWYGLVPLLPILFLLSPGLWRHVCPLATLGSLSQGRLKQRDLSRLTTLRVNTLGIVLLGLLIPARRFLLNENGLILAFLFIGLGALIIVNSAFYKSKAGFCNSFCPVLAVEKLYGQEPLIQVERPRCQTCALCTAKGCVDLSPNKAISHAVGRRPATSYKWMFSSYGVFAGAFPGFMIGYFTIGNVSVQDAGLVYLHVGQAALISYISVALMVFVLKASWRLVLPILAAISISIYYWFTVPQLVALFDLPADVSRMMLTSAIYTMVGFWLGRALHKRVPYSASPTYIQPDVQVSNTSTLDNAGSSG